MESRLLKEVSVQHFKKVFEEDVPYVVSEIKELILENSLILLEGDLGAGKTFFSKIFIGMDSVSSPSYSLINDYKDYLHADLYRLEDASELITLELPLYLEDKKFILVEWGEKFLSSLVEYLPENFQIFKIMITQNDSKEGKKASRNYELFEYTQRI